MPIGQLGMMLAGAGLGQILAPINDRRQLRQQEKLQNLQIAGEQQMTDYNLKKQIQLWEQTNYKAQVEQLKKAGLNPALLYGEGGAGGATTNIESGKLTQGAAPTGGGEIMGLMGMGLQSQMIQAQIELTKAQTQKTQAETGNVPLTGENIKASTASITQGIENQKVQAELIEAQRYATNIMSDINARSSNSQVASAARRLEIETQQLTSIMRENGIGNETIQAKIAQIKAESVGAMLNNFMTEAQTRNINQDTKLKWQQIQETLTKMSLMTAQEYYIPKQYEIQQEANRLREQLNDLSDPNLTPQIKEIVSGIIGGIIGGAMKPGTPKMERVGYK